MIVKLCPYDNDNCIYEKNYGEPKYDHCSLCSRKNLKYVPIEKIKKKCLCCGKEMELRLSENKDFCDKCYIIVCQEVYNKANDGMTVKEVRERIKRRLNK